MRRRFLFYASLLVFHPSLFSGSVGMRASNSVDD